MYCKITSNILVTILANSALKEAYGEKHQCHVQDTEDADFQCMRGGAAIKHLGLEETCLLRCPSSLRFKHSGSRTYVDLNAPETLAEFGHTNVQLVCRRNADGDPRMVIHDGPEGSIGMEMETCDEGDTCEPSNSDGLACGHHNGHCRPGTTCSDPHCEAVGQVVVKKANRRILRPDEYFSCFDGRYCLHGRCDDDPPNGMTGREDYGEVHCEASPTTGGTTRVIVDCTMDPETQMREIRQIENHHSCSEDAQREVERDHQLHRISTHAYRVRVGNQYVNPALFLMNSELYWIAVDAAGRDTYQGVPCAGVLMECNKDVNRGELSATELYCAQRANYEIDQQALRALHDHCLMHTVHRIGCNAYLMHCHGHIVYDGVNPSGQTVRMLHQEMRENATEV